jgi:GDP-L-fucose synthase
MGEDVTIKHLAELIGGIIGYSGKIVFDTSKPDGTPLKLMDVSLLTSKGWRAKTSLQEGLRLAYLDFLESEK